MDTKDAMKAIVSESGYSMRRASELMGRSPNWLANTLARSGSSEAATVAELAEVCGYRLALVPCSDVPPSAFVIDPAE